jgi:hypothetical protein
MKYWLYFICVILLTAIASSLVTFGYFKLLEMLKRKYGYLIKTWFYRRLGLLKKTSNQTAKSRQETNDKIKPLCSLNSPNNRLNRGCDNSCTIQNIIVTPDIGKSSIYQKPETNPKYHYRNLKSLFHLGQIIKGRKRDGQPHANRTVVGRIPTLLQGRFSTHRLSSSGDRSCVYLRGGW